MSKPSNQPDPDITAEEIQAYQDAMEAVGKALDRRSMAIAIMVLGDQLARMIALSSETLPEAYVALARVQEPIAKELAGVWQASRPARAALIAQSNHKPGHA